jgi:hypothetical protein
MVITILSYKITLNIIDRLIYYCFYVPYLTTAIVRFHFSPKSELPFLWRITCLFLFPIYLFIMLCLTIVIVITKKDSTIDVTKLQWPNNNSNKFRNELILGSNFPIEETLDIWDVYYTNGGDRSYANVEESTVDKIMHIFQNGIQPLNTMDLDTMLTQTRVILLAEMKLDQKTQADNEDIDIDNNNNNNSPVINYDQIQEQLNQVEQRLEKLELLEQNVEKIQKSLKQVEEKNIDRFQQLDQKLDKLMEFLQEKFTN